MIEIKEITITKEETMLILADLIEKSVRKRLKSSVKIHITPNKKLAVKISLYDLTYYKGCCAETIFEIWKISDNTETFIRDITDYIINDYTKFITDKFFN